MTSAGLLASIYRRAGELRDSAVPPRYEEELRSAFEVIGADPAALEAEAALLARRRRGPLPVRALRRGFGLCRRVLSRSARALGAGRGGSRRGG